MFDIDPSTICRSERFQKSRGLKLEEKISHVMHLALTFFGLCIKVRRGQGDGDVRTRVWGLGTWGCETRDLRTSSMGRGDVKYRDEGDAGCE